MTDWKTVHGENAPLELDTVSSVTTVYQRRNIHEYYPVGPEGETSTTPAWEYEERTMTQEEYAMLQSPMMRTLMQTMSDLEVQIAMLDNC